MLESTKRKGRKKKAELLLRQAEDEARQREEEDDNFRKQGEYKNRVKAYRKQRELCDEMDRQRLRRGHLAPTINQNCRSGQPEWLDVSFFRLGYVIHRNIAR